MHNRPVIHQILPISSMSTLLWQNLGVELVNYNVKSEKRQNTCVIMELWKNNKVSSNSQISSWIQSMWHFNLLNDLLISTTLILKFFN